MKPNFIIITIILVLSVCFIGIKLFQVQVLEDEEEFGKDRTRKQQIAFAKPGRILDRNGIVLWDNPFGSGVKNCRSGGIYLYEHLEFLTPIIKSILNGNINIKEFCGQDGVVESVIVPKSGITLNSAVKDPLIDGKDIYLTIDVRIQEIVENSIKENVPKFNADGASVVVMDPRNGQIMALTSFNPEIKKYGGVLHSFEPGSIFKPITAVIALENGVNPNKNINAENGSWYVAGNRNEKPIGDTHPMETCNMQEAMINSSNIVFGKYAMQEMKYKDFFDGIKNFGISESDGNFPLKTVYRDLKKMQEKRDQAVQGFGHSIYVTVIDMIKAFGAIANGGTLYNPKLILKNGIQNAGNEKDSVRKVLSSSENTRLLREMLKGVVEKGGTAENIRSSYKFFEFAGKTGTAQIVDSVGNYSKNRHNSSFIGMESASDPHFVCLVTMYNTARAGATAAGPVFQKIMEQIYLHPSLSPTALRQEHAPANDLCGEYSFIGYSKDAALQRASGVCRVKFGETRNGTVVVAQEISADANGKFLKLHLGDYQRNTGLMPDVRGLSIRDAMGMLEHVSSVKYEGFGFVVQQYPEPGKIVSKTDNVLLKLRSGT